MKSIAVVLTLTTLTSIASAQDAQQVNDRMRAVAELMRAQAELTRAQAEASLNFARAELIQAQTLGELQRVRELTLRVNRLEIELKRTVADEFKLREEANDIQRKLITMNTILTGKVTPAGLRALGFFKLEPLILASLLKP